MEEEVCYSTQEERRRGSGTPKARTKPLPANAIPFMQFKRTTNECFKENTRLARHEIAQVGAAATAVLGSTFLVLGEILKKHGSDLVNRGLFLDPYFPAVVSGFSLADWALATVASGNGSIASGSALVSGGVGTLVGGAVLVASYFGASYAFCALDPES